MYTQCIICEPIHYRNRKVDWKLIRMPADSEGRAKFWKNISVLQTVRIPTHIIVTQGDSCLSHSPSCQAKLHARTAV